MDADHFLASRFRGVGSYDKVSASTVRGALRAARLMEAASRTTQKTMVYAVGKDGKATFLTPALINRLLNLQTKGTKS